MYEGMAYLPEDRKNEGIIADLSVLVIFILKFCFLDFRLEDSCNLIGVHLYVF